MHSTRPYIRIAHGMFARTQEASEHGRLGSNTYKRLNLGLVASSIGIMAFKATAEQVQYDEHYDRTYLDAL